MTEFTFDPLGEAFRADPYAIYEQMRGFDQPYFFADQNMHMLTRYQDIATIAANPDNVRSLQGIASEAELAAQQRAANFHDMPYHERYVQFSLLDSDGSLHRRLRKQVFGFFQTKSVNALEPVIRKFVSNLIDELRDNKEIDFIADFARYVPGFVIGHFLGAPAESCDQLRQWSEDVVRYFDVDRNAAAKSKAEQSTREFCDFLIMLKATKIKAPSDDLISKMISDETVGKYSEDEFLSTCMLILMAGHGSTIDVLGSSMHTLLRHPDALAALRQSPQILATAIQEMFRYEPPLPFFHRHATQEVTVGGIGYPAGTTFGLLYGSANHDPLAFERAECFDINRSPNRHLAFGMGAHLCLGNNLARLNMKIIYELLFETFAKIELIHDDVPYKPGLSVRGPERLDVAWS